MLPQAARRLDTRAELWPDEVRIRVERLNLDAASFRQLERKHTKTARHGDAVRAEVLDIVADPRQDAEPRDRLRRHAGRHRRGGRSRVAARPRGGRPRRDPGQPHADPAGHRGRPGPLGRRQRAGARATATPCSSAARSPPSSPTTSTRPSSLSVMDVCGAPALTARVVEEYAARGQAPVVAVIGGAGKSGSPQPGRRPQAPAPPAPSASCPTRPRPTCSTAPASPTPSWSPTPATRSRCGTPSPPPGARPTSPSCASTSPAARAAPSSPPPRAAPSIFFSMATSFSAAALGAEGLAADVPDARRQRLRPGPRGVRPGAAARQRRRPRTLRAEALMARTTQRRSASTAPTYAAHARWPARSASRSSTSPSATPPCSVERATLRLAGLGGADPDGTPWVNRLADVVRADVGLEHGVALPVWDALLRGEADDLADPGAEGGRRLGDVPPARGQGRHAREHGRPQGRRRPASSRSTAQRVGARADDRRRSATPRASPGSTSSSRPATSTRTSRRRRPPPARAPTSSR